MRPTNSWGESCQHCSIHGCRHGIGSRPGSRIQDSPQLTVFHCSLSQYPVSYPRLEICFDEQWLVCRYLSVQYVLSLSALVHCFVHVGWQFHNSLVWKGKVYLLFTFVSKYHGYYTFVVKISSSSFLAWLILCRYCCKFCYQFSAY